MDDDGKMTDEEMEDAADAADNDDLPVADLPQGLVRALADAGVKTKEDWDEL